MSNEPLIVAFSFGKTSAFMSKWLKDNYADKYDLHFLFANTGRESEETLLFGHRCDQAFNLNVTWLEAVISPTHGVGPRHKIVSYETANRTGEPFKHVIQKEGIPNVSRAFCTDRLKTQVMRSWMRENGFLRRGYCAKTAIGMRADEPGRCQKDGKSSQRYNLVYPLAHWTDPGFDKQDVNDFWETQDFNLNQKEHVGNCLTCFKKSDKKLFLLAKEHSEYFDWNEEMEWLYSKVKAKPGEDNYFFRSRRSTKDLLRSAKVANLDQIIGLTRQSPDDNSGCGEECHPFS